MSQDPESFVLVLEPDEVRRHVPEWPDEALLAARARPDAAPEIRRLAGDAVAAFAGGLPVVPIRPGLACATPTADAEARLLADAVEHARALVAGERSEPAQGTAADPFADVQENAPESQPAPSRQRFLIRRRGAGFELRTVGIERFPWDMTHVNLGASMLGVAFVEQPLDRMLTFAVSVSDLGPMAPMAGFLPKRWTEVPLAEGPSGPYFDISPVLLAEVARRVRRATVISTAAIGLVGFLLAAAVVAALWTSPVHPPI